MANDFYAMCPKDMNANIAFREKMIKWGSSSKEFARDLWIMCKRDQLFWINTFCFTHNPRLSNPVVPFITYEFQDEALLDIERAIGHHDYLAEKSRDMGLSWIFLTAITHQWIFFPNRSFLCVSSKEDLVDRRGFPSSLFYKIDLMLKYMPGWLKPSYTRNKLAFRNEDNDSTIDGESTTGEVGRGGRSTAILLDEFAQVMEDTKVLEATRDNTNCRLFNSTPSWRGTNCAFFDLSKRVENKGYFHWTKHPVKAQGLYYDPMGKPRSPWYDEQCKRALHPAEIATQLDIDYLGAASQFFSPELIDRLKRASVDPLLRGEILFDADTARQTTFMERSDGELWLWDTPIKDKDGVYKWPSNKQYSIGADISYGTGASNSALSVVDTETGRKVAEWANCTKKPHEWAKCAVALCRWFNGAFLIWEANGPGRIFGDNVITVGYRKFFYRQKERTIAKDSTEDCGWYATPETKAALLGAYQKALTEQKFVNLSERALAECLQYVFAPTGGVVHSGSVNPNDPSGARSNHSDLTIADALACKGMGEIPFLAETKQEEDYPELSLGWRLELRDKRKRLESSPIVWVAAHA